MRPSRCASSCRLPKVPEIWIATEASGKSIAKFATLETTSTEISPALNESYNTSRSAFGVFPVMSGACIASAIFFSCVMYCPIIKIWSSGCRVSSCRTISFFASFSLAIRCFSRKGAAAYSISLETGSGMRISVQ